MVIICGLIGSSNPALACSIGDGEAMAAKTDKSDRALLSPRSISSSYLGPGGHDYRDGRLAKYLQLRKAERSSAPGGPFPPPPAPTTLEVRVPVILIEYPDAPMTVTASEIEDLMFGSGSSPNMTEYYEEVSYGQFSIDGDVYGPYQVSTDYADYTASDREAFITEAIELADGDIDYSLYDADGDGYVDAVIVVASEYIQVMGYESAHRSSISDYTTDEGMIISDYTSQKEDCIVGVYCHEFGHILGLPDLYTALGACDYNIGDWGLMGQGAYIDPPAHFCGWCKIELGWLDPIEITESVNDQPIGNVEEYGEIYKLSLDGLSPDEYLLVENRQLIGSDAGLPGSGLLIWHIGYEGNNVTLVPAGSGYPDDSNDDESDPFPGLDDVREYIDETFGVEVTDISDSGDIMNADFIIPGSIHGWLFQESSTENDLYAVFFTDDDTGWTTGESGIILHTDDGGENWEEQESGTEEDLRALYFTDSSTGWAVGDGGTILYTSDGGDNWIVQDSGITEDINSVSFIDSSTGWAITDNSTVLSTSDGGSTWTDDSIDTDGELPVDMEFASEDYGFIAGENKTIFYTTDGGASWSDWDGVADELTSSSLEISKMRVFCDNDLWLLGNSNGAYLIWVWEGYVTYLTLGDYKNLADFDFSGDLGIAAGERLVVMNLSDDLGFGLELFSLGSGSSDHRMDNMEWVEVQEWSDNLENAPLAVDVASGSVAYVVGENGMILRYDREDGGPGSGSGPGWTNFTTFPPPESGIPMIDPVTRFNPEWVEVGQAPYWIDPTHTMPDRVRFYLDNGGPVVDWPIPIPTNSAYYRNSEIMEQTIEQQSTSANTRINIINP